MATDRALMQQALEALSHHRDQGRPCIEQTAYDALRARLAEIDATTRSPLTPVEIAAMWRKFSSEEGFTTAQFVRNFARAIERAHKITGGNDE